MRQALVIFLACFLGALAALLIFHQYQKHDAAKVQAALDAEQQARIEQGRELAEQTLANERTAQAIHSDVTATSGARLAIAETYMSNGRMPASNAEAGLPDAKTYKGQSLVSLQVAEGGTLILTFDAHSGIEGGVIEWRPDLAGVESMGIQWQCTTSDYPEIVRALPGCTYAPRQAAEGEVAE